MLRRISLLLIASIIMIPTWNASAQNKTTQKAPAPPKSETVKVKTERFKIELKLPGVFESAGMTEISFKAKAAPSLTVLKAVEHGATVTKGDTLITPMLEKFDKALKARQHTDPVGALAMKQAEAEFAQLKAATPLKLAAAKRNAERAQENLEYFKKNQELSKRATIEAYQSTADRLAYIKEELRQLKKMYQADDLTDATEEIVLRRTEDSVRRAELSAEQAKMALDAALKTNLARQAVDMVLATQAAVKGYENAKVLLPLALEKATLDIEASRRGRKKAVEALANLKADRGAMTIKAPVGGVVYYGRCSKGKWSSTTVAAKLTPKGKLLANEVFMTIVDPKAMLVRVSVPEKDFGLLASGLTGRAVATAYPRKPLTVKLDKFSTIPTSAGQFDARLTLSDGAGLVAAGMTCKITLTVHDNPKAITAPVSAILKDAGKEFVYVKEAGGKKKRPVETGKAHAGKVEIIKGLTAGETIFRKASK
ncbi:MAG: HlyD family efflux transporter periplasmic adaptor subunit [Phycisphaerae bacterium]|jgi:multidrug efflux pump subunit AcrA (membrane-fusion protein)|nr:HlyD family efflux transporter periplasmic adaptor subunit [Phycisphaerae bacterium]